MHPLAPDLSQLTDDDLQKKMNDLTRRFMQATKFGPSSIISQIGMLLEDYQTEIRRRQEKLMEEMLKSSDKRFNDIIDIS